LKCHVGKQQADRNSRCTDSPLSTYLAVVVEHVVVSKDGVLDDDPVLLAVPDNEGCLSTLARHRQVHGDGPAVHVVVERAVLEGDRELLVHLLGIKVVQQHRRNDLSITLDKASKERARTIVEVRHG
jgi:hypothetical protein